MAEIPVVLFAYARPEMLIYDLGMVGGLGFGLMLGWSASPGLFSYLGRFTLEILASQGGTFGNRRVLTL